MLAPPAASRSRSRRIGRFPRLIRSRALVLPAVGLVVLLGGTLASAAFGPGSGTPVAPVAAAQLAPPPNQPPIPIPTVDADPCGPDSPPLPICTLPTSTTAPSMTGLPLPTEVPTPPPCDPAIAL
ncbi:MAG TPA: hypothetical protein VNO31_02120, partial [Umezawaea sp.]|nr:hypothetical protein [Umezawaea sp.]